MDQSDAVFNPKMLLVIGCKQNHIDSHFLPDLSTKSIECWYRLTEELYLDTLKVAGTVTLLPKPNFLLEAMKYILCHLP